MWAVNPVSTFIQSIIAKKYVLCNYSNYLKLTFVTDFRSRIFGCWFYGINPLTSRYKITVVSTVFESKYITHDRKYIIDSNRSLNKFRSKHHKGYSNKISLVDWKHYALKYMKYVLYESNNPYSIKFKEDIISSNARQ